MTKELRYQIWIQFTEVEYDTETEEYDYANAENSDQELALESSDFDMAGDMYSLLYKMGSGVTNNDN